MKIKCYRYLWGLVGLVLITASCRSAVTTPLPSEITLTTTTKPTPTTSSVTTTSSQGSVDLTQLSFGLSWHAGETDVDGITMYGTEIMRILPYKGKLYASNSMWMESDPSIPKACQLLVLDSPDGKWRLLHQFTTKALRLVCLQTVTFTTDAQGKKIQPVTMLLTAPDTVGVGDVQVFSLDDKTNELVPMSLGMSTSSYASTRAIGFHRDSKTGIDLVFAGNDVLGMFSGSYDPNVSGRIKWQGSPELAIPVGERVMGFTDCNGVCYCATSNHIYKRFDGPSHSWEQVYYDPKETNAVGIRGLTSVPNPSGNDEVLLFRSSNMVRHIDPADNNKETAELDLNAYLTKILDVSVSFNLCAYNDFLSYTVPDTGEKVYLFGCEITYPAYVVTNNPSLRVFKTPSSGIYAAEGRFFIRHANKDGINFELAEIIDPSLPTLVSVRTIAISPFAADRGQVIYFGGFDCNYQSSHNTAWIYRGEPMK